MTNDKRGDGGSTIQLLVTIPEATRMLAIGRSTLYELIAARQIATVHIGRAARITVTEIEAFVARTSAFDPDHIEEVTRECSSPGGCPRSELGGAVTRS